MARLYSDLGQRTVFLRNGLAKARGVKCVFYTTGPGVAPAQLANLAHYDQATPDTPGAPVDGAVLTVDPYSNRPIFWDLDDRPVLYVTANNGPVEPIYPTAQPQLDDHDARLAAMEPGGVREAVTAAAAAADATAKANAAAAASIPRTPGKNLFDQAAAAGPGKFWNGVGGVPIDLAGWYASALIPVTVGQTYTINNCRNWQRMDANGQPIIGAYVNNPSEGPVTFTVPSGTAYVTYNVAVAKAPLSQMEVGSAVTAYQPAGYTAPKLIVGATLLTDAVAELTALQRIPGVAVLRSGDQLLVRSAFDAGQDILMPLDLSGGFENQVIPSNDALAFVSLIPANTPDAQVWPTFQTGLGIHGAGDDNAPLLTGWSYVGGNHGYTGGSQVTMAGHGKTTADLGSQWSDGVRTYTLLTVIDVNTLLFGNPYTVSSNIVTGGLVAPAATLTHVSGATNTAAVTITGGVVGLVQLHPCTYDHTVSVELDGKPVPDGKAAGQVLTITESYLIASYKGMIDTAQANIGTDLFTILGQVPAMARVSNTYRITPAQMVVAQRVTAIERFSLSMGVTQAFGLVMPAGGTRRQFMAGIGTAGPLNLSTLADLAAMSGNVDITPATYLSPLQPAVGMSQWVYNSAGVPQYGLAVGILPVGDGHPLQRIKNAVTKSWFIANSTKKNYPQIAWNKTMNIGDSIAGTAYRAYLAPPDTATELVVSDGTDTWVIVERASTTAETRMAAPRLLGRRLTPAQPVNTARLSTDVVTGSGVAYAVPSGPGYGVWRAGQEPAKLDTIPGATGKAGDYFVLSQAGVATQPLTGSYQILYLHPMYVPEAAAVDRVCVEITTLGTGVLRHGIYANDPATGQPSLLGPLYDFGTVDITSTGIKETPIAAVLPAGWHWYGQAWQLANTTPPTIRVSSGSAGFGPLNLGVSAAGMSAGRFGYYASPVPGAFGALAIAGTHQLFPPRVAYRRA